MAISSESNAINGNSPVKPAASPTKSQTNGAEHGLLDFFKKTKQDIPSAESATAIRDTVTAYRSRITTEVTDIDSFAMENMTVEKYLDYISGVRLSTLPHRGSIWDNVLRWADFFGVQITTYAAVTDSFAPGSEEAAKQILTLCRSLLLLGPTNAPALRTTFSVFNELALSLAFLLRHKSQFNLTGRIRKDVCEAYNDLLRLVFQVTFKYKSKVSSLSEGDSVGLDFYATFGRLVDTFESRKQSIIDSIWINQLGRDSLDDITVIRRWLAPQDPAVVKLLASDASGPASAFQLTCEWFERDLLDFTRSNDKILAVVGVAGTGKSVLAGWTKSRLQRPLGRTWFDTLSYTIDSNLPAQASSIAIVQSLLLQLLELSVGNTALFNALEAAYRKATKDHTVLEEDLWKALELGFDSTSSRSRRLCIVIDGLGADAKDANGNISQKLHNLSRQCRQVQAVVFSAIEPQLVQLADKKPDWEVLHLTPDLTHEDIKHVVESTLRRHERFNQTNHQARLKMIEDIVHDAAGSFLWARLLIEIVAPETTPDAFQKAVKDGEKSLQGLLREMIKRLELNKSEVKLIVSWLLVAERPLSVTEIKCLMEVDLGKKTVGAWNVDVRCFLIQNLGSLIMVKKDFVTIRHDSIRTALLNVQKEGKRLPSYQDAQLDILKRVLTYARACFAAKQDPVFDTLPRNDLKTRFQSHPLLEYAIRYWIPHFKKISSFKNSTTFNVPDDLKLLFPTSPRFAAVEWTLWDNSIKTVSRIPTYDFGLRVYQKVFSDKHETVMQRLIILGTVYQKLTQPQLAADYYYRAVTVGQAVLPINSTITINCSTTFLILTESFTSTTRTEIVTQKETILRYIIKAYKEIHGESSELVIRYYRQLATLYTEIHDEEQAVIIYRELRVIIIKRYGEDSEEDQEIDRKLRVVLKSRKETDEFNEYDYDVFAIRMYQHEQWTIERIRATIVLAISYMKKQEWSIAEETFVTLWSQVLEICCTIEYRHEVQFQICVLDVALEYVKFLEIRSRHEEACSVLIVVQSEYENSAFDSVEFMSRLKMVAVQMKSFQMFASAKSLFQKISRWFEATGRYDHEEARSCSILISQTETEISTAETRQETSTANSSTEESEEIILQSFMSSTSTKVTSKTIATSRALFSLYTKEERWTELIVSIEKTLSLMWSETATLGGTVTLPHEFVDETLEFALLLASAHIHKYEYLEAEDIYIKIYRACKSSMTIQDERFSKIVAILLAFYEERKYYREQIVINKELVMEYKCYLGQSHKLTIKTLYALARLVSVHGYGSAEEYYSEIVRILNKESVVHVDAYEATIALFEIYYTKRSWIELDTICKSLWHTWVHYHVERKFDATLIELLYARYTYTLRYHLKADWSVLRKIAMEYREVATKSFGETSSTTVRAMVSLSEVLMERKETMQDAMQVCQSIIKVSSKSSSASSSTSQSFLKVVKQRMSTGYMQMAASGSLSSSTSIETALSVVKERYDSVITRSSYASSESLKVLEEVIMFQKQIKTVESQTTMIRMVRAHTLNIVTMEKSAARLCEAAYCIAKLLIKAEILEFGRGFCTELRRQIVVRLYTHSEKFGFKVEVKDQTCYVFLARLEAELFHASFASVMADLLTETFLYEHYGQFVGKSQVDVNELLVRSAKLHTFWVTRKRVEEYRNLEQTSFDIFWKTWAAGAKCSQDGARVFYMAMLDYLGGNVILNVDPATSACIVGNDKVLALLQSGSYQSAYEVAYSTFHFANTYKAYQTKENISLAFKLASLLVGRGVDKPMADIPVQTRGEMHQLSRNIMGEILASCSRHKISFARLPLHELSDVVALLGAQGNYAELERILADLWQNREGRRNWPDGVFLQLGRRYIEACALANHMERAIHLAEDIRYNLQRVGGVLDEKTLEMSVLLSELYSRAGRYVEAMQVHEEILRYAVNGDDDNDRTVDEISVKAARKHIELLRATFIRNERWDKTADNYQKLVRGVLGLPGVKSQVGDLPPVENWNTKEKIDEKFGVFVGPRDWGFA